jgi:hypothetical protein
MTADAWFATHPFVSSQPGSGLSPCATPEICPAIDNSLWLFPLVHPDLCFFSISAGPFSPLIAHRPPPNLNNSSQPLASHH